MLVGDLNLNPLIKESTPALFLNMENDPQAIKVEAEQQLHDVEEGEISDSASVEEISEEDFNTKQPSPQPSPKFAVNPSNVSATNSSNTGGGSGARVLTMRDLYKYQISPKTSYSGLYNLAWAQAVNNKPLGDVFVMMEDGSTDNSSSDNNRVVIDVEDDDEKEEGELEEGEIDLDSEVIVQDKDLDVEINKESRSKRLDLIMEELVSLNATDAQK